MNLDDKYILVFVRQNMFPDKQMVHGVHLGLLIGKALDGFCQKRHVLAGHPSVLVYGADSESALNTLASELQAQGIEVIEWRDPDAKSEHDDFGLTGIISQPITKTQRNKLRRYRQWSANNNIHPFTHAVVAQSPEEHSPIKREVGVLASAQRLQVSEPKEPELLKP